IRNLVAPPTNNTYVPFGASPRMCPGIELVKMETSAMIHLLPGIIIVALLLVNESVNAKNPTNPSDFSINSSIGNATSDASLLPPSKEENGCMA
ncbi:cytochrome P450 716B1-like protein, partial [Tanacetum coccineum]